MQGTQVRALVREDPPCHEATKPVSYNYWACALEPASHNYWACALEPASHNYWSPRTATTEALELQGLRAASTEARAPRARAPQQEKPPQWEAHAPQQRVAPARRN